MDKAFWEGQCKLLEFLFLRFYDVLRTVLDVLQRSQSVSWEDYETSVTRPYRNLNKNVITSKYQSAWM